MIRVLGCIFGQHDMRLVVIAAALCVFACATALTMVAQARTGHSERVRLIWLAGAGAVAGCGIWATHFIAMLAFQAGLPLAFDPGLTILSAAIAAIVCAAGFTLAVGPLGGAVGGALVGAAICAMHYTGMQAVEAPARQVWDLNYVAASFLIGVSLSGLSLHVALKAQTRRNYILGAGLFALAIMGMHFTAMSAVTFIPESGHAAAPHMLNTFTLAIVVAAGAAFIIGQALIVALVDRYLGRRAQDEAARMRAHIQELEDTQKALKKASWEAKQATRVAAEASKAKSAFLASMSHELRTPLNAIIGFSDTMQMEVFGALNERYKGYVGDIHTSGEHLLSLINDILDLSRLDAGHTELREETFDTGEMVDQTLRMVVGQAQKAQVSLVIEVDKDLPWLKADKRRIKQILLNLISNALKFTQPGGQVTIRCHVGEAGLVLSVADSGIGIAPENIALVMEPFGQVDNYMARQHVGTGLGLPLSRELARLHGGDLVLESQINVGTTVTLSLPPARLVAESDALTTSAA